MSRVHEATGMRELGKKAFPSGTSEPDKALTDDQHPQAVGLPSARAPKEAHFSPDPLKRTDRYRLVHPFDLRL